MSISELPAAPPPMFSRWYGEALRDVFKMEHSDVFRLERDLAARPDDFSTRLKLMAYHQRPDRSGLPQDRLKRLNHVLWLIEHHPDSEILRSHVSRFSDTELSPSDSQRATTLWDAATKAQPANATVLWNAASFFESSNPDLHLRYLEQTAAADPNHPFAIRPLAHLYARSTLNDGRPGQVAQANLDASKNVWILSNAAWMLQMISHQHLQAGRPNHPSAGLAERYYLRAKELNPKLDRNKILPELDLAAIARARQVDLESRQNWERNADKAIANIRRLPVSAFPKLPATVAAVLRARNCRIPQPMLKGAPRNVVRGEFFVKGQSGWAVLCSVKNSTSLLAFRNDSDTNPAVINTTEDRGYLQFQDPNEAFYSREIMAVSRDFIMGHYRAYGGAKPPPITHQGLDDSFLEKASVTWYFHRGKWLPLQGAD